MKKIVLFLLLLILPNYIYAYENDYFTIEIPKEYNEVVEKNNEYTWTTNNEDKLPSVVITLNKNPESNKQNIEKFTEEDLNEYKDTIKQSINNKLKDYNLSIEVSDIKKETINDYLMLTYLAKWPTDESFGYNLYQKSYLITTDNYIVTLIYSTTNENNQDSNEIKNILKSLKVNDNKIKDEGFFAKRSNQILVVGCIAGAIGYILSALKKKKAK